MSSSTSLFKPVSLLINLVILYMQKIRTVELDGKVIKLQIVRISIAILLSRTSSACGRASSSKNSYCAAA